MLETGKIRKVLENSYDELNSWGEDWGYNGYIYLSMGENTCGIADEPTTVTL